MTQALLGVHHVTAIAGDPQRNIDFYTQVLGLRLVKITVNYDDPGSYHFYYGDALGRPGTILTFFAWPGARRGRQGTGQVASTALAIPTSSLTYWTERLLQHGVAPERPAARFDEQLVAFRDPDGLQLELVAHDAAADRPGWDGGSVPAEHAIRGVHTVTLWEAGGESTATVLVEAMGFRRILEDGATVRYETGAGGPGALVDVRKAPSVVRGEVAVGTVHHVAWRTPSDTEQRIWRQELAQRGLQVTPVMDRQYFHSVYYREPGGVLFEIATDPPGFTADESPAQLGTGLRLPAWLEPHRATIAEALPPVRLPSALASRSVSGEASAMAPQTASPAADESVER